jgi:hypothetical protein
MMRMTSFLQLVVSSTLTGAAYAVACAGVAWLSGFLGGPAIGGASFGALVAAGTVIALLLGPIAARMQISRSRHLLVWGSAVFFNLLSVVLEGAFYADGVVTPDLVPLMALQQLVGPAASGCSTCFYSC